MKIKPDSAIYKALKFANTKAYFDLRIGKQTTLCSIVAGLLCFSLVSAISLILIIATAMVALAALFTVTMSPITGVWLPWADTILVVTLLFCCTMAVTTIFCILQLGLHHENVTPKYLKAWLKLKDEPSESFLSHWLKDRKEKICTIVTLEE